MSKKRPPQNTLAEEPCAGGAHGTFAVGLYIRVSTDRQAKEGDSLEEQESELKKYCDYRGFHIYKIFVERGKSGGNTNRPEYQKLVAAIEAKKINAIIVKKLDRLSRSLLDFEQLMTRLQVNEVEFISLKESFDTTTAMGKAMLRIALVFAQLEREQTAERISDVMQYRASIGLHNGGNPTFGYTCVNKEWVVFQKEKEVVELIFNRFREVKSTLQIATMLNDMGIHARRGKPWDCRRIMELLQNPSYLGHRKWKDQLFKNTHPPIIAEKHFQEVEAIFKKRPRVNNLNAPFQKLLTCGDCLSPLSPSYSLNHAKVRFYYYRCTRNHGVKKVCALRQVGFKSITDRTLAAFAHFSTASWLKSIENKVTRHNQLIEDDQASIRAQIQILDAQKTKLKDQQNRFLDSMITEKFSGKERDRINAKLDELDLALKQVTTQLQHHDFTLTQQESEKLNLPHIKQSLMQLQQLDASDTDFREILNELIKGIVVYKVKLTFSLRFLPFELDFDG